MKSFGTSALTLVVAVAFSNCGFGDTLLSNNFDGNAGNDIGPGFELVTNNYEANNLSDASTGLISFRDDDVLGRDRQPQVQLVSTSGVDASAAQGFTVTWDVQNATTPEDLAANGWFFGVQTTASTLWNNSPYSIGVNLGANNNALGMTVTNSGGSKIYTEIPGATIPDAASLEDGFTVILTINSDGTWNASTVGWSTEFNQSGLLSDLDPSLDYTSIASSVFGTTAYQISQGAGVTGAPNRGATYSSVTITTTVPEPSSMALLGLGAACVTRRRCSMTAMA